MMTIGDSSRGFLGYGTA